MARVVVPVAYHAETSGSFVNAKGVTQHFTPAVSPPPGVRPAWETLVALAKGLGKDLGVKSSADVQLAESPAASATSEARA